MIEAFVHPETGEVLQLDELRRRIANIDDGLSQYYRELRILRVALAERTDPAALPVRRARTDKQAAVTRCPRCGERIPK